jgi:hypothetical protein
MRKAGQRVTGLPGVFRFGEVAVKDAVASVF